MFQKRNLWKDPAPCHCCKSQSYARKLNYPRVGCPAKSFPRHSFHPIGPPVQLDASDGQNGALNGIQEQPMAVFRAGKSRKWELPLRGKAFEIGLGRQVQPFTAGRRTAIAKCATMGASSSNWIHRTAQCSFRYLETCDSVIPRCSASRPRMFSPSRVRPVFTMLPTPIRKVWQAST